MKIYFFFVTILFNQFVTFSSEQSEINYPNYLVAPSFIAQNSNELIVSFEKLSPKQFGDLELLLSDLPGIRKIGFCEKMNVFYFSYDTDLFRSNEEAFDALILKTKNYQPLLKIGATSADVQRECIK